MLRVGERVLLLALSEERDKHPLGYLSSRLLMDAEGEQGQLTVWQPDPAPAQTSPPATNISASNGWWLGWLIEGVSGRCQLLEVRSFSIVLNCSN